MSPTDSAKNGFERLLAPVADFLVARGVSPNSITTLGTALTIVGGGIYGWGHIHLAGWIVGLSAICDVLDGAVARKSGRSSVFGAFYDSTLDRIADGAVLGGLAIFFARNGVHYSIPVSMSTPMVSIMLLGIIGSFLTSYTRARAEGLGIEAKVGMLQRPERIILLSAPQAFFGLALGGWVLMGICILLAVTAWITVIQRILFVYHYTAEQDRARSRAPHRADPPRASGDDDESSIDGPSSAAPARLADVSPAADARPLRPGLAAPPSIDAAR